MLWRTINSGVATAEWNMSFDAQLLHGLASHPEHILHFYDWEGDSVSHGYFLDPWSFLNRQNVEKVGLHVAKRPTGGGITFHLWDFTFSVLVPSSSPLYSINTLDNYATINRVVAKAITSFLGEQPDVRLQTDGMAEEEALQFCMAAPISRDILLAGRKVAGGAQRRTKHGFLHQGTISLIKPCHTYLGRLLSEKVLMDMERHTGYLLEDPSLDELETTKDKLRELLHAEFKNLCLCG